MSAAPIGKNETIPELRIQFTKRQDGTVVLRCVRRDGSVTWERHDKHGAFFAFHDLIHLAVETTMGFRGGFYGLIADGWDILDTTGKGSRGKLSDASALVEHIVGLLSSEQSGGALPLTAEAFNRQIEEMLGSDPDRLQFTDADLKRVRNRILELHTRWAGVPAGSVLDLTFNRD